MLIALNRKWRHHSSPFSKLLRIMKLAFILLTVAALQVSAGGYTQSITLTLKNAPLEKVFESITRQSGYRFFYNEEQLQKSRPVTINIRGASLEEALNICLKDQLFTYTIVNKVIVIKALTGVEERSFATSGEGNNEAAPIDIHGRVVNEKTEPVEGVTVTVKGTKIATSTNANGEFSLRTIDPDAVLVFTSVNMETFELIVSGKTDLIINLKTKITALVDVQITVNTGYQKVSKERMVGAYSQLDSANYHRRAGMDIISRLDGTVTGVLFDKKGGANPLQIRGISTIQGNINPLIILDDFPMDERFNVNSINPNDVESITVLKDAAAASIWGTRAGNGVIVITTKKGKYNQPLRVSVSSIITFQEKPDLYYYPQMSIADFIDVEQFLFNRNYYDANLSNTTNRPVISPVVEILAKRRAGIISSADSATQINALKAFDLRNELDKYVYQKEVAQQHYLNISGGNNIISYQFSGGYNHTTPNIQGSKGNSQYTFNSNTFFRPVKNLEIQTSINYSHGENKGTGFSLPNLYPYARLADENGNSLAVPNQYRMAYLDTAGAGKLLDWHYRPLEEIRLANINTINRFLILNFGASYKFTNWLNAEIKYRYQNQTFSIRNYSSLGTYLTNNLINQYSNLTQTDPNLRNPVPVGGIMDVANGEAIGHNIRGQLNFNKNWGARNVITALVAGEITEAKSNTDQNRFYGYDETIGTYSTNIDYSTRFPIYGNLSGNADPIPNGSRINKGPLSRMVSLLANVSYTYNNRYTLYASARRDGSNVFGVNTNNKWQPLWSSGASWDISKETFYSIKWMPSLRVRISYGYMGNVNNTLSGLPTIQYLNEPNFFTGLTNAIVGTPPNPDLRWEQVGTFNAAVDFNLFKNRLSGSFDVFNKKSTDLISLIPFDITTGVAAHTVNSASLKTNGFEFNLNSKNIQGAFEWNSSFALSYAKTIVTKIGLHNKVSARDFINYGLHTSVGKLAYGIASYHWGGLDPATGDPQGYLKGGVSKDYNAIFNDTVDNQVFHGSSIPLYFGFLGNSVTWKNITLSAQITYRLNYYFRKPSINYSQLFRLWESHADYALRWQKPGDEKFTNVPSMVYPVPADVFQRDEFYQSSEVAVLRGDNIRLQDVRLSYNLDKKVWKRLPINSAQLSIYANNLNTILWRKDKSNLDPDFSGGAFINTAPPPRTWTVVVNVNF